jgi:hypothetical protein
VPGNRLQHLSTYLFSLCYIEIKEAYGDKAYFRKSILDTLKADKVKAYIPVSESAYKFDDTKFAYNKDSDQ